MAQEASGADGSSGISMLEIDAEEILTKVRQGQPVEYDHVIVKGDLDLSRESLRRKFTSSIRINDSIFDGKVSFNDTTLEEAVDLSGSNFIWDIYFINVEFSSDADFREAIFGRNARFKWAIFSDDADFSWTNFGGNANFRVANFGNDADFRGVNFCGDADFTEAIFSEDVDFRDMNVSGNTIFDDVNIGGNASFSEASIGENADFWGANFGGDADFGRANFGGDIGFESVNFGGYADFTAANFNEDADFWEANFGDDADFTDVNFGGDADFRNVHFDDDAKFRNANFGDGAYFSEVYFTGNTRFQYAEFNGNIEFSDTRFEHETSFYRVLFKRPAYFENSSIESLNLTKAEYSRLHLRWDDIKSLHFDEAAYLALIKNYNTLGWYGDANDCYYDYRNAVRRSWQAPSSGFAARLSSFLDRFVDFGEWLLYGYGVRPSFPIAWSVVIILAFGLFFRQKRCMRKIITEEKIEDARDGSDEVLVKSKARKATINSLDPFLFSLFTFTSGFTAFLHPAVEYKLERCLRWAIAERLLGPFFLALVITTISKTYLIR